MFFINHIKENIVNQKRKFFYKLVCRAGHTTTLPRQLDHVFRLHSSWLLHYYHRIKDDRIENYSAYISSSSQSSIAAQQKIVLADGSLCSRQQSGGGEGGEWGVGGGAWHGPPCSPSALTQIVPISASIYTVFHSVIFNSVIITLFVVSSPVRPQDL